eukprot:2336607-Rhodomonas_salina.1
MSWVDTEDGMVVPGQHCYARAHYGAQLQVASCQYMSRNLRGRIPRRDASLGRGPYQLTAQ